jgi:predicted kinase
MNAKEIIEKFKEILLSKPEEVAVEAIEVQEEVVLSEQKKESLAEEPVADATEDIVEDVAESEDPYATKEELAQAIAQMKAMYDQIMESMSTEVSKDAPAELAEATELSAQEEVKELTHSPEEMVGSKNLNLYAQKRAATTFDLVLSKISKQ